MQTKEEILILSKRGNNMIENNKKMPPCCSGKHKMRHEDEKKLLVNRLKRIEGQVRGICKMVESDAYCTDILVQVSAVTSALNSFNKSLLETHIKTCVADGIEKGDGEVISELCETMKRLMR